MGHRANYVVIENGKVEIYYTHWGAITLPTILLSGPEGTLQYARELKSVQNLMEIFWAHAGCFLDYDKKQMSFFACLEPFDRLYIRRQLVRVLAKLWPGWSVTHEAHHQLAFYQKLGKIPYEDVEGRFDDKVYLNTTEPLATEAEIKGTLSPQGPGTWITVRTLRGELKDWMFYVPHRTEDILSHCYNAQAYQILSSGPGVLKVLSALKQLKTFPQEGSKHEPEQGAFIDEKRRIIWFWENFELHPHEVEPLALRWPGWQIHKHADGMIRHLEISRRSIAPYKVPDQRAIAELIAELSKDPDEIDPLLFAQITQQLPKAIFGEDVEIIDRPGTGFASGFFRVDKAPTTIQERKKLLRELFRDLPE